MTIHARRMRITRIWLTDTTQLPGSSSIHNQGIET
jgi:hypothetical protein